MQDGKKFLTPPNVSGGRGAVMITINFSFTCRILALVRKVAVQMMACYDLIQRLE